MLLAESGEGQRPGQRRSQGAPRTHASYLGTSCCSWQLGMQGLGVASQQLPGGRQMPGSAAQLRRIFMVVVQFLIIAMAAATPQSVILICVRLQVLGCDYAAIAQHVQRASQTGTFTGFLDPDWCSLYSDAEKWEEACMHKFKVLFCARAFRRLTSCI